MARAYREYHELCAQRENHSLWLAGVYTYNAVSAALESAFAGKGKKPKGYMDRPIPITKKEQDEEKARKIQRTLDWVKKGQEEE